MRQKFSMAKRLLLATIAAGMVAVAPRAIAQEVRLADNAPTSYTVQKGDTLWGIAGKFLQQPWRWPEIWRLNRDQIKNPHWIYPGDVVRLEYSADGAPRLSLTRNTVQVLPSARVTPLDAEAIPSIPPSDLEPYLTRPLLTGPDGLANAAEIVAGRDRDRVIRGQGDRVYVVGMDPKAGALWHIYRPGKALRTLDGTQVLGFENRFLGTARVERFADVSTALILLANEEILLGDRLIPAPRETIVNYVPHAPAKDVEGRIISSYRDSVEMGRGGIVAIDKGLADGVDVGTVLAIYRGVPPIADPRPNNEQPVIVRFFDVTTFYRPDSYLDVPQERTGLMFVFRAWDYASYALLLNTTDPVQVGDFVRKP